MSDLIDRYLMAVSANLPKKDRADITAELRDILYSKVEDRAEQLGHTLSKAEEEALLREFGHPLVVAGRYGRTQYLIGPAVYPFYISFLKVVMGIIVTIFLALFALFVIVGGIKPAPLDNVIQSLFTVFAAVTLTFVAIERTGAIDKMAASWKPSQLPMMGAPQGRSPFTVLFEIAMVVAVIAWWVGVLHIPAPAPKAIGIVMGPVWQPFYWPVLALLIAQIGIDIFELVMPGLMRAHAGARIVLQLALIGFMVVLAQGDHWVIVTLPATAHPGAQEQAQAAFDNGFRIGIAGGVLSALYEIWLAGRRLVRIRRLQRAHMA
jgi:hypothetical protein